GGTSLKDSPCVSCGACASTCPSGAIDDKTVLLLGVPERFTRTTCPYCGVGCELDVGVKGGRITQILPALDSPVNKGHACVKGRYAWGFLDAPDRVTRPLIRKDGVLSSASWDEAIGFVAGRLKDILAARGPSAVGVLGSSRSTNEENYVAQKFARVVLGTNNVDCCARVCHAPTAHAMAGLFGTGAATSSYDDLERARTILVCGANATENHPVVGARIRQAARRGTSLIVIDPRRIELAAEATIHLATRPGTNVALLQAMAHVILREGLADEEFLRERVVDVEQFRTALAESTPERVSAICHVPVDRIVAAARLYATAKPGLIVHGLGATEHRQGSDGVAALSDLALLTGNVGKPGSGVNPLRGQNNVQGSAHMGCEPSRLTGYVPIAKGKAAHEALWGSTLPAERGRDLMEMIDAAGQGALSALWCMGYDVAQTNPHRQATIAALKKLELLVVQDLFVTETAAEAAHVVIPAAASFEKDGTFMNAERRVSRVRAAVSPPTSDCRPDWVPLAEVARALGHGEQFAWHNVEQIWDEIRVAWPPGQGMAYRRLEQHGLQWPCPDEGHPGSTLLHGETFSMGKTTRLAFERFTETPEHVSEQYPFLLVTGRTLHAFNAGTMTGRTKNLELRPTDVLDIHPVDAGRLGIDDGAHVRITSARGEVELPARLTTEVHPGELFTTFHDVKARVNDLTGDVRDTATHTPEYKVTAVALAPVGARG
ncbi:MAG: formate dehydrogenase subunit alpha, partial [Deltaproteobacteria bacterium RBG_16_71_12]